MRRWVLLTLLLAGPAQAADITVLSAGAINSVAQALTPAFEASTGNKVRLSNDTVGALVKRIDEGEEFDVVMMSPAGLAELAEAGKITSVSRVRLAQVGIGVGIRTGSPKPNISTVSAFKAAMLKARKIAYIDPASGGSSGIYVAGLFRTLGIAKEMSPKSVLVKGGLAAKVVADGQADIVLQQISELMAVPGITLVGPLPEAIQSLTTYSGAVSSGSAAPDAARAFLAAMASSAARPVLDAKGLMPP